MPYVSGMLSTRQQTRVGSLAAARVSSVRKGAKTGCSSQQQSLFTRHFAACWLYNVNTSRFPCFSSEQSDCHSQRDRLSFQEKLFGTRIVYKDNRLKLKSSYHYHFKNSVGHQTYKCVLLTYYCYNKKYGVFNQNIHAYFKVDSLYNQGFNLASSVS